MTFTIKCEGGCGREMRTERLTVLWSASLCPECEAKEARR